MQVTFDKFTVTLNEGMACSLKDVREKDGVVLYDFLFCWTKENAENDDEFVVAWGEKVKGVMYKWDSVCKLGRNMTPHWEDVFESMLSTQAPVSALFDGKDTSRYCWALSECRKRMKLLNGWHDLYNYITPQFSFNVRQFTNQYETVITLYVDKRTVALQKAVADVAAWWEYDLGMTPLSVPPIAREPLYSFWYAHHQFVNEELVEKECRRAKELGFEICIVDDGWHTDDTNGGYAYCGDWIPAKSKFPNMAEHVKRVHEIGMKYVLWYSVPLIGYRSEHFKEFEDMLLRDVPHLYAQLLDPRYKKARDFMVETYKKALIEWDLDGFKLDFIDSFALTERTMQPDSRRDTESLEEGVDRLMKGVKSRLTAIKPDVLIEFRQSYVGPSIREYGNMLRVGDCPNDAYANRESIVDLRLTSGETAVHSDMLMWHYEDTVEAAALQVAGTIFSVPQISVRIDKLPVSHYNMLRFYLAFIRENRDVLLNGKLTAKGPEVGYHRACAEKDGKAVLALYHDTVVREVFDELTVVNVSGEDQFIFCGYNGRKYKVYNCMGELLVKGKFEKKGPTDVYIPRAGMLVVE